MKKFHVPIRIIACTVLCLFLLGAGSIFLINSIVVETTRNRILTSSQAAELSDVDCVLVLGCKVWDEGQPSHMLEDRLRRGVELYEMGAAPKLLMSGDHGRVDYDEVDAMKRYGVDAGISSSDIFMDHAGFSTYESMYRAKEIFQAKKIIIVSQEYHLYRALFVANMFRIEAYGVSADYRSYVGQTGRDIREVLARVKDFATSVFKPDPTYLGEVIPISGDGNLTNDENSDFV
jgi:vancomycin permeability regulator SanA